MKVLFYDLLPQHNLIDAEISAAIDRVRNRSFYILGPEVEAFEAEYSGFHGVPHTISVGNGFDALALTLRGLGIGPGDEVITTTHTFIATVGAISASGATPILVDCQRDTLSIDPVAVEAAITPRTKAVIAVHLYGRIAEMESLVRITERHHLALIEDAAQAHGARIGKQLAGTFGVAGCFSFYPTKNLGALGDGGAIITRDAALAHRLRLLRNYGSTAKYQHEIVGFNSRLDDIQAAILRAKLTRLDEWNDQRRSIAARYLERLQGQVDVPALPRDCSAVDHAYHLFVVACECRDEVRAKMDRAGIQTAIHYPIPVHRQKAYESLGYQQGEFPNAEAAARRLISLPLFPGMPKEQIEWVITSLIDAVNC
ncbi:DegT/DnrJ/EryC1/StrS family aminotransferase [bacterium]|nr:DegT/DnrJ/EryC1/StrS family aminotransferase [bacterium]